jgi:hypothetical protein
MKKLVLVLVLTTIILAGYAQDIKIGVRFNPLNSSYMTHELMNYTPNETNTNNVTNRFDSLTIGIFFEKYFAKQAFLIRVDMNYADMQISNSENISYITQWYNESRDYKEVNKQKYFNINLGIGTHINWSKLTFTFGAYVPFTFLSKGEQTRDVNYYEDNIKTQNTIGTGTYKPTMGIGIGAFGGVSTTILKHLSIGLDVSYQIEYLSRILTWHGETNYYGTNPYMTYADETMKMRNYFTSKVVPSIVIAYAFNCKKKAEK